MPINPYFPFLGGRGREGSCISTIIQLVQDSAPIRLLAPDQKMLTLRLCIAWVTWEVRMKADQSSLSCAAIDALQEVIEKLGFSSVKAEILKSNTACI